MRGVIGALLVWAGSAAAHPGHGAPEGHFHWVGAEHVVLLLVVAGFLAYALRK